MRASSTHLGDSPVRIERVKRNLTIGQVAQRTGLSKAIISLAESGRRRAPAGLLAFLSLQGAQDLAAAQEAWREAEGLGRNSGPTFTFRCRLPKGLSVEQAGEKCAQALAEFVAGDE